MNLKSYDQIHCPSHLSYHQLEGANKNTQKHLSTLPSFSPTRRAILCPWVSRVYVALEPDNYTVPAPPCEEWGGADIYRPPQSVAAGDERVVQEVMDSFYKVFQQILLTSGYN